MRLEYTYASQGYVCASQRYLISDKVCILTIGPGEEEKIRDGMIKEDVIEGIVALPPKLFYGSEIPDV
jgi:N-6 DNA Methylase